MYVRAKLSAHLTDNHVVEVKPETTFESVHDVEEYSDDGTVSNSTARVLFVAIVCNINNWFHILWLIFHMYDTAFTRTNFLSALW